MCKINSYSVVKYMFLVGWSFRFKALCHPDPLNYNMGQFHLIILLLL